MAPDFTKDTTQAVHLLSSKLEGSGVTAVPSFHIVLGSGFGEALNRIDAAKWKTRGEWSFADFPSLVASTVPDHAGKYRAMEHVPSGRIVIAQMGRVHGYEGHHARQVVQTVMIPRLLGIQNFVLTNAAGGLASEFRPGDAMVITDHVNLTGQNPLVGENPLSPSGLPLGPRFPDMSGLYDPEFRKGLKESLKSIGVHAHEGVYLGLLGPSFETPAEVQLFARWGLHAVGMSTVWEAIALRHSGAKVAGMSLISNLACGLGDGQPLDHHQIVDTCRLSAENIVRGIFGWLDTHLSRQGE